MPTVAEQLQIAREGRSLTLADVAETTKIKTDQLRALESGQYQVFAAPVYVRGFVRTYATLLKLDVPALLRELDLELSRTEKFKDAPQFSGLNRGPLDFAMLQLSKINWTVALPILVVAVALVLGVLGFRAYKNYQSADPLAGVGSGLYQPTQKAAGDTLPLPTNAPARR